MKTLKYILFAVASLFLLQGCNDNDWSTSFADDELPKIYMNNWTATQAVNLGTILKWEPIVSPSDGATFRWTKNGEVISEEKDFEYTVEEQGEFELKFEVTRNGISTHRATTIIGTKPFVPKSYNKKVIAYIDAMEGTLSDVNWEAVTHIVVSSAIVNADGDIDLNFTGSTLDIDNLIALAHNNGIYVSLQIAGEHVALNGLPAWGSFNFYETIKDEAKRNALVDKVLKYITEKEMDGIDIYMDKAHDGAFDKPAALQEFYEYLAGKAPEKSAIGFDFFLSTSAVVGWTRDANLSFATMPHYDWISILAFAQEDLTPIPHSSVWSCSDNAAFWADKGAPSEKIIIACPAFSIKYDLQEKTPTWGDLHLYTQYNTYRDLLANHPDAYQVNSMNVADGIFYDGFPAIEEKAQIVINNNYGGLALWKCGYDTSDKTKSLIVKINSALNNQ